MNKLISNKIERMLAGILLLVGITACNSNDISGILFTSSSPSINKRFQTSAEYNKNHSISDIYATREDYSFYVVTDIHCNGVTTRIEEFVATCLSDHTVEQFVLNVGDLIRGKNKMESTFAALKPFYESTWSFFSTPGNHELFHGEWDYYIKTFCTSSYTFNVVTPSGQNDLFICLDSAEGTVGTDQRAWLEGVLSKASSGNYRNIVIFTHTNFFSKDNSQFPSGSYALEETTDLMSLFAKYGVDYVFTGHDHFYEFAKFRGVEYYTLNAFDVERAESPYYMFTFTPDGITHKELIIK